MRRQPFLNPALFWLGFLILFVGVAAPALADPILDSVGKTYSDASKAWETNLVPIAKSLFIKLAMIEVIWSAIWWVIEREDPNQVIVSMLRKIMPLMFFWAILLNFDTWIPAVIDSFVQAGQTAGGTGALTPSTVLDRGLEIASTITTSATNNGLFDGISGVGRTILAGLCALGILLAFGVIAGQMLVTLVESYIVVSGGVLFLGFAGSRWTTTFAEKYISYAVSVGVKLFVTYLIIGAGQHLSDTWAAMLGGPMMEANQYMAILVGAMVYMFLAWQIPSLASSMLTGAVSMTLGSAAATVGTMMAGAAGAAGLAQAGLAGAGNSVAGAVQAGNAAIDQAKAGGASGMLRVAGGATGALASAGAGAVADSVKGLGAGSTGGNLANRMGEKSASLREAAAAGAPAAAVPGGQPAAPAAPAPAAAGPAAPGGSSAAPAAPAATPSASGASPAAPSAQAAAAGSTAAADGSAASSSPAPETPPEATRATPAAPASSVIDTSGNVSQALADRDSGAPAAPPAPAGAEGGATTAQPAAPAEAIPSAPTAPASSGDSTTPASPAPASTPAAPAAPAGAPAAPAAPERTPLTPGEDKPNALQKLSEHASALGAMPNDSAAGAGVQINLKHD